MRGLAIFAGAVFWASASVAAPFDCTRQLAGSGDALLRYSASSFDRIVDLSEVEIGTSTSAELFAQCGLEGSGRINGVTGTGSVRFDNFETYRVTVRGDLGTALFDEDFSDIGQDQGEGFFEVSDRPPDFRLDFRPRGGRNLSFTYPNGFSVALACPSPDTAPPAGGRCGVGDLEFGPFFLVSGEGDRATDIFSDGGAPLVVGTVPLPAGLPLALGALGALGWVSRKRRR